MQLQEGGLELGQPAGPPKGLSCAGSQEAPRSLWASVPSKGKWSESRTFRSAPELLSTASYSSDGFKQWAAECASLVHIHP